MGIIGLNAIGLDGNMVIKKGGGNSGGGGDMPPTPDIPVIGDGKTYLYIKIDTPGRMKVPLYFSQTVANGVTIDWGDGSATQTLSGTGNVNTTHTYAEIGEYTISLDPISECTIKLGQDSSSYCVMGSTYSNLAIINCNRLQAVEIGRNILASDYAFQECTSLLSVVSSDNTRFIGQNIFKNCSSLSSIIIPEGTSSIANYAFSGCSSLSNIIIPDSVSNIGNFAFQSCTVLSSIVIPNSVKSIYGIFNNCDRLTSVTIPDSVTTIGEKTFADCNHLTSVTIPDSVTTIGNYAFSYCPRLTSVTIPNSVTEIGRETFYNCSKLTTITIPDSVTTIGDAAFEGCTLLSSIVIKGDVIDIGSYAFKTCKSLSSIIIPDSVTTIGDAAFYDCKGMVFYDFSQCTSVPTLGGTTVFYGIPSDCKIVVPDSLYDTWKAATNWATHASKIVKASEFNS